MKKKSPLLIKLNPPEGYEFAWVEYYDYEMPANYETRAIAARNDWRPIYDKRLVPELEGIICNDEGFLHHGTMVLCMREKKERPQEIPDWLAMAQLIADHAIWSGEEIKSFGHNIPLPKDPPLEDYNQMQYDYYAESDEACNTVFDDIFNAEGYDAAVLAQITDAQRRNRYCSIAPVEPEQLLKHMSYEPARKLGEVLRRLSDICYNLEDIIGP